MSRFQNRLFELRQKGSGKQASSLTVAPSTENSFSGLDREGFRQCANRLGANTVFVVKLRDCQIDPNTISTRFQKRVAGASLSVPLDVIVAHFAARIESQTGQFDKSDLKPTTGLRQSFQEAVQSSRTYTRTATPPLRFVSKEIWKRSKRSEIQLLVCTTSWSRVVSMRLSQWPWLRRHCLDLVSKSFGSHGRSCTQGRASAFR